MSVDIQRTEIVLNNRGARGVNGTVVVSSATGQAVSSRVALAAITTPAAGQVAYLAEAGREGTFVFDSSNLTTSVSGDPAQAIYVPPSSATSGASGAWVRKFSGAANAKWFGAVGDSTTNDATALQRWLDYGGALYLPVGQYRSATVLLVRKNVFLTGASYGFDGRIVGYAAMPGSRIVFDAGVSGLDVQPQWTGLTWASTTPTQEGGMHSIIENLGLIGNGGATAFGFRTRTVVHVRNVHTIQFSGNGFDIDASATVNAGSDSGNASISTFIGCHAKVNGGHGFYTHGIDANVVKFDTCDAILNTGWGFTDAAGFSNLYLNCHTASNTAGSYKTLPSSPPHTFVNCYMEGGQALDISAPCAAMGGNIAGSCAGVGNTASGGTLPAIISGDGYSTQPALHINHNNFGSGGAILQTNDRALIAGEANYGALIQGRGGTYDFSVFTQSAAFGAGLVTNSGHWKAAGNLIAGGVLQAAVYSVATLPAGQPIGTRAIVNDANANTFATAVVGGGANVVPVYYDGTWRIG